MEKTIEGYKFDRLRNRLPLVVAVFLLSYPLSFIVDKEYILWLLSGEMIWTECLADFGLTLLSSFLFVEISVFYCKLLLRFMPFSRAIHIAVCSFTLYCCLCSIILQPSHSRG